MTTDESPRAAVTVARLQVWLVNQPSHEAAGPPPLFNEGLFEPSASFRRLNAAADSRPDELRRPRSKCFRLLGVEARNVPRTTSSRLVLGNFDLGMNLVGGFEVPLGRHVWSGSS